MGVGCTDCGAAAFEASNRARNVPPGLLEIVFKLGPAPLPGCRLGSAFLITLQLFNPAMTESSALTGVRSCSE